MKPNELRIGNWVYDTRHIKYPAKNKMQITEISKRDYKHLEPIPLTAEILEKCSVKELADISTDTYLKFGEDRKLYLVCDFVKVTDKPIEYLHQLQNLIFSLTGKELEVKL